MATAAAATAASTSLRPPSPSPPRLAVVRSVFMASFCFVRLFSSRSNGVVLSVSSSNRPRLCTPGLASSVLLGNPCALTRAESVPSGSAQPKDYEELAENVMNIVDRLVHKTNQKIEQSTDVLKLIISPAMREGEDVKWPPRDPDTLKLMEKEISHREQEGQLDEGFLSEVSAQLRQAKQDGDKPGLEAMLQKVLQMYASRSLQKRSYAYKGGEVVVPEKFLESVIQAPENEWNKVLLDGLTVGKGDVSPDELYAVINKRIERVLIRTEGGSYQQRILVEYLKEIQARAEEVVKVLQGPTI
ncbi:hypothetical protein PR202_ga16436 [Eleusine coracana subsp. coracana]|uniref:Uncharacterized protein n=1 Tax=Eleusine coracana subsp. coracana TaxID=191504 RepID=A0AAV5CM75_ELECO|nr:hypothetical protein PR202_ga16436 [Eleusine coracana subsp. coracana]